jgi:hypothetical protein
MYEEMKKWFEFFKEVASSERHHDIMMKEFGETKTMIEGCSDNVIILKDESTKICSFYMNQLA